MLDERDGSDAIRALDDFQLGRRRLKARAGPATLSPTVLGAGIAWQR